MVKLEFVEILRKFTEKSLERIVSAFEENSNLVVNGNRKCQMSKCETEIIHFLYFNIPNSYQY